MHAKTIVALLGLAIMSVSVQADRHQTAGPHGPPMLHIPLPPDFPPPPPPEDRDGRGVWFEKAFGAIDQDGDGLISKEEMMAAIRARREARHARHDGGEGEGPREDHVGGGEGEGFEIGPIGLSADHPELAGLPEPPPCGDDLRTSELGVQEENKACEGSESVGNLIFRTVCNAEPYNSEAISLPPDRAADCFDIEAIRGSGITFEIIEESTGNVVFNTIEGPDQFKRLVLTGGPSGTVYRIVLLSGDSPDASITVRFIDHPTF